MKLIIQIPCYNEEKFLPVTLKELPRKLEGIEKIEWLVINDGSTDNTVKIAKKFGVDHIVSFKKNVGLARAFMAGIEACIDLGADIIVNTDADNQYNSKDIAKLVNPILEQKADIVVGNRPIYEINHFSPLKKVLSKFGSWVVKNLSKVDVEDAPSGFRAFSREAALRLNVFNDYTYTMETLIQAGVKKIATLSVPIEVNDKLRSSRLFKSIYQYIKRCILIIFKTLFIYKPRKILIALGVFLIVGAAGFLFSDTQEPLKDVFHIFELWFLILGGQLLVMSLFVDLISTQRKLLENIQYKLRKFESNTRENQVNFSNNNDREQQLHSELQKHVV